MIRELEQTGDLETQLQFPEQYSGFEILLATGSMGMIDRFRSEFQAPFVKNVEPKREPKKGGPRRAATAKNNEIIIDHRREIGSLTNTIIFSADVAFRWDSEYRHRPDRDGELTEKRRKKLLEKAIIRYSRPFMAEWHVSFAIHDVRNKKRKLTTLEVFVHFPKGIPVSQIEQGFSVESNAMMKLVEAGAENSALYAVKNRNTSIDDLYPTPPEAAVMLIRDKILPPMLFFQLLENETDFNYKDKQGHTWGAVTLALGNVFRRS